MTASRETTTEDGMKQNHLLQSHHVIHRKYYIYTFLFLIYCSLHIVSAGTSGKSSIPSLYKTLGVDKDASASDIKKAYRKLALKTHPDKVDPDQRSKAETKFKEVSRAYEILSDEEKRKNYDQFGNQSLEPNFNPAFAAFSSSGTGSSSSSSSGMGGGEFPGGSFHFGPGSGGGRSHYGNGMGGGFFGDGGGIDLDLSSIFEAMMGGGGSGASSPFFGGAGGGASPFSKSQSQFSQQPSYQQPRQRSYHQRPKSQWQGQQQQSPITRNFFCTLDDLANPYGCTKKLKVTLPSDDPNDELMGKIYTIKVQPGWKSGTKVNFKASSNGVGLFPPITFVLNEKPHAFLKRQGDDLHWTCSLSPKQAEKGARLKIPLPDGELFQLDLDQDTRVQLPLEDRQQVSIPGKGMPIKGGPERGCLIIKFRLSSSAGATQSKTA